MRWKILALAAGTMLAATVHPSFADKKYGPGVTDTEIKVGQTMPYSGPASAFSILGRIELAYFKMINSQGGINGRKVNLVSLDDGYSPPKAVEQARKLVEEEQVLALFSPLGTPPNIAMAKYLNAQGVPQLLASSGSPTLDDPKLYPWTTLFFMSQRVEGHILAAYVLQHQPNAKIAILYQNDDYGKGYLKYFKEGLGDKAATMVIKEASYDLTDPTIDSQMVSLQASGADVLYSAVTAKFAAQVIRKRFDLGWKATHLLISAATSLEGAIRPAGVERAVGTISVAFLKTPGDPTWDNDAAMKEYFAFMKQWAPGEPPLDQTALLATAAAQEFTKILKSCGDELTRENLMKQALNVHNEQLQQFAPGVLISITPESRSPFHSAKMIRFDGERWQMGDEVVTPGS
jgi:ABC-type branched-subunit amino acid transport system substrate-binding protein